MKLKKAAILVCLVMLLVVGIKGPAVHAEDDSEIIEVIRLFSVRPPSR